MLRPWSWPTEDLEPEAMGFVRDLGMPRAVARTLVRRGFHHDEDLARYLHPKLGRLGDPATLDDIDRAVERVWRAVDANETIFVHGDYDVDGITGTAFLARTLRAMGAQVIPYVPDRSDGYGLSDHGVDVARDAGARVLITVDNGTRAFAEIERARDAGLDVVVLDHHELAESLPVAYALVNPQRNRDAHNFAHLSGVGVAAKFVHALAAARPGRLPHDTYKEALQLVALGTIADSMPLVGENRILVRHGLAQLSDSQWAGIKALKALARLDRGRLTSSDVAFFLAPRINAAGRMGEARNALELLLTDDPAEAYRLADHIERLNAERRQVEHGVMEEASARIRERDPVPPAVVLWSDGWAVGVIGIVASRVLERYRRPAFLVSLDGEMGRGSARSLRAFPLPEALQASDDLLEGHGGHAEAAGFTIRRDRLVAFRDRMESLAGGAVLDTSPEALQVDAAVGLGEMDAECVRWVEMLSPFGRGNPEPLFGCEGMVLSDQPSVVGKRHLRFTLGQGEHRQRAIAFNFGDRVNELKRGQKVDALFHAAFDTWRGGAHVQLVVRDLKTR